jgi:hypothetical protein
LRRKRADISAIAPSTRGQLAARNRAVHAVVVGADPADGRERGFPARPEREPLALTRRRALGLRAVRARDGRDAANEQVDLDRGPVELDDQKRGDVERIADADERLGRVDRRRVHHLHAGGDDAGAMIAATHAPADSTASNPISSARAVSGRRRSAP